MPESVKPASRPRIQLFRRWHMRRILEIERRSFPAEAYTRDVFRELHRECGKLFFIARLGRRIAGYVVTCAGKERAEIVSIAVDPQYRRQGVAAALMAHTLARLETAVDLTVRPENAAAIAFYRTFGFARMRLVKRYYEDGGDGVRMRKFK